jgi:hypothetical protein
MIKEVVYVLAYGYDQGNEILGVYRDLATAEAEKNAIIRDRYNIPENEVSDDKLDDEIARMDVYYEIVKRHVL